MIDRLHVNNFKSLRKLDLVLEDLTILIGRNEAGKSNILDVLKVLASLVKSSMRAAEDPILARGGYRYVVWNGEVKQPITIGIEGQLLSGNRFGYTVGIGLIENNWVITQETFTASPEGTVELRRSPNEWAYKTGSGSIQPHELALIRIRGECPVAKELIESITTWSFYNLSPELMSHGNDTAAVRRLNDDGSNLSAVIHTLVSEGNPSLSIIEEHLKAFSPEIEKILAPVNESGRTQVAVRERGLSQLVPAPAMSYGTLYCLGLAVALFGPTAPDLLTFEEPDAHAHTHLLELTAESLLAAADRMQVIATTHRPVLLDFIPPKFVTVVEKVGVATTCIRVKNKKSYLRAVKELGASKAWYSGSIGGVP